MLLSTAGRLEIGRVYHPAMGALALLCLGLAGTSAAGRRRWPLPAAALGSAALTLMAPVAQVRAAMAAELQPRIEAIEAASPLVV